ncbi:MAG: DUF3187 family protein [Desulfuromonadaceae bacterium]|nr:DUF3187 family protein [Desulfuromonadaceae bacterium]MDD5105159.1 DUF3187 family protein [Desulfuromonadaceae bacterium]
MYRVTCYCLLLLANMLCSPLGIFAAENEVTPFQSANQSPLVHIYGLPRDTGADIISSRTFRLALNQDLSSNYTTNENALEQVILDGETYRLGFSARYGVAPGWEAGIEIPYLIQGGGFLDGFIINWHNMFGLPQGGRDIVPRNRVNYSYRNHGIQKLRMEESASGLGDISLTGGFTLYDIIDADRHDRLTVKSAIKLPTGDSGNLFGSGSTDLMLQLCGSVNRESDIGTLGAFGSLGGLLMSRSDVLSNQHNPVVGIGSLGFGWGPASWISFKVQFTGNTSLYRGSTLDEISGGSLLLLIGGTLRLSGENLIDIGVAEDLKVGSAPDVSFHLGMSTQF